MAKAIHKNKMSFLDHLEDLRWHIIRALLAIVICGIVAFMFKGFVFDVVLLGPKHSTFPTYEILCNLSKILGLDQSFCFDELPFRIQSRKVAAQFSAHMWTSITAGFIVAFPYIIYQMWSFVSPALYTKEKRSAKWFIFITSFLFFLGVLFGYYVISPLSIRFLGSYQVSSEVFNDFDLDSYIGLVKTSALASGLMFELPIIIYFLAKWGLVTPEFLKTNRKYALVLILIVSAIITPPDIASQFIVSIPVVILYEISIIITKVIYKKQLKKEIK
ncbi:twin-arginine translocase subunit TatC [Flavobacteriaceae bacterium 14752]|nr:twin-arginine translocase subunit TatC [Flavobacteriaceae bacterium 14752]